MFKKWKQKRDEKVAAQKKIENDEYLTRLKNSAGNFSGSTHYGGGPFLSINEINHLMREELKRQTNEVT